MNTMDRPLVPRSQRVFGETVYWITVLAAIICIVGPLISFINMDNNVLNPHFLMQKLFDGKPAEAEGFALVDNASAGATTLRLEDTKDLAEGKEVLIRDEVKRETAVIASVDEDNKIVTLESPLQKTFIVGKDTQLAEKTIWDPALDDVAENPQGGHFWKDNLTAGDGFTQLGLVLGCAVGLPAMVIAALVLAFKEKSRGWALGALWISFMVGVSIVGLISLH